MQKIIYAIVGVLIITVVYFFFWPFPQDNVGNQNQGQNSGSPTPTQSSESKRIDFSNINNIYRFSGEIKDGWQIQFVPQTEAINIYDPGAQGSSNLEKSQIFIRYFEANDFLTLSAVDILSSDKTSINGHQAVNYEIIKKPGIADFAFQPSWRSRQHKLTDVRLSDNNPSVFYVISYNPFLDKKVFDSFIDSLIFHNDQESFVSPLGQANKRVTKKPFGIFVTSQNSPVQPERFSGYHTGADFEILPGEENRDIAVKSICGGTIRSVRSADGYGGLIVQECLLENQLIMVIYGHIRISGASVSVNQYLPPNTPVAFLGTPGSETDGERKHLHLGIKKGSASDIRGYVGNQGELLYWINPLSMKVPFVR